MGWGKLGYGFTLTDAEGSAVNDPAWCFPDLQPELPARLWKAFASIEYAQIPGIKCVIAHHSHTNFLT